MWRHGRVGFLLGATAIVVLAEFAYTVTFHGRFPRVLLALLLIDGILVTVVALATVRRPAP